MILRLFHCIKTVNKTLGQSYHSLIIIITFASVQSDDNKEQSLSHVRSLPSSKLLNESKYLRKHTFSLKRTMNGLNQIFVSALGMTVLNLSASRNLNSKKQQKRLFRLINFHLDLKTEIQLKVIDLQSTTSGATATRVAKAA